VRHSNNWWQTYFTYIWVFNVGRGLSVCVRFANNIGLMYDLGASEDFSPAEFVEANIAPHLKPFEGHRIAQVTLSHPHADHILEIPAISGKDEEQQPPLCPRLLTCPQDKSLAEAVDFARVNNLDSQRHLVESYREAYKKRELPLRTIPCSSDSHVPNVEYGIYYLRPPYVDELHPDVDQEYTNALSLVLYLRHGHQTLLIPGDITPEAMTEVLFGSKGVEKRYTYFGDPPLDTPHDLNERTSVQPDLCDLLSRRGLTLLIAPHHGLESGFSEDTFQCMQGGKPLINIISEGRHLSKTAGTVDARYQNADGAQGIGVDIDGEEEFRYSVSTRAQHSILIVIDGTKPRPRIYLRSDPQELLSLA